MTRLRTSTTSSPFSHSSLRWSVASSLLLLALAACAPAAPVTDTATQSSSEASIMAESTLQAGTGTTLTIELQTTQIEDAGTPVTTAVLHMSGTIEGNVTLPPITGTLSYVDPRSYIFAPPEARTTTLAVLSAWFAGGGQEVAITRDHINKRVLVWYRAGDEGTAETAGECTPLNVIASHDVPEGTEVRLAGFSDPIEHSALNYCGKPLTK